jgi:hypothetical protein
VFPGDDPLESVARFCQRWQHQAMQEALAAIVTENIAALGLEDKLNMNQTQ